MTPEAVPAAMASGATPAGVTYGQRVAEFWRGKGKYHSLFLTRGARHHHDVLAFDARRIGKDVQQIMALMRATSTPGLHQGQARRSGPS